MIEGVDFIRRTKRIKLLLVASVCVLLAYFLAPVIFNKSARWLIREDQLVRSDLIVALGGDHRSNREKRAAELYHQGWGRKVVVNGLQFAWGIHTGEAAKRYVMSLGVPEADILIIRDTLNTRAEAREIEKLMRERDWHSAIIVTSAFHSRRAMFTIEKEASDLTFYSSPVAPVAPEWQPDRWWSRRGDVFVTSRELVSWVNTLAGGWQ
jgi:uncharacterized SAM-binding protein YcdF (DUF218 family)